MKNDVKLLFVQVCVERPNFLYIFINIHIYIWEIQESGNQSLEQISEVI